MSGQPERRAHHFVMEALKQRLGRISEVIPQDRPVVYLDYPVHDNIGDLLIHQGADAFLEDYGYTVLGRYSLHDFARWGHGGEAPVVLKPSISDLDALLAGGKNTLVLHGGGNLGDIWPHFQFFREQIIQRYPHSRIVILPQSIHFDSAAARARAARVFATHPQLYTFVRDAESLQFVQDDCGGEGEIMPDMAHQLWGRAPYSAFARDAGHGTLVLRRRDKESRNHNGLSKDSFDWADLNNGRSIITLRALRKWQTIDNPLRGLVPNYALWRIFRDRQINGAVDRVAPYAYIDTDRLHGMILGALMSKRVRYGDGTYGKLHRYARLWLAESDLIEDGDSDRAVA